MISANLEVIWAMSDKILLYVVLSWGVFFMPLEGPKARANDVEYCPAVTPNYKTGIENLNLFSFLEGDDLRGNFSKIREPRDDFSKITKELDELLFHFDDREKDSDSYDCISKYLGSISLSLCTPFNVQLKFNIFLSLAPEVHLKDEAAYCLYVAKNFSKYPNDILRLNKIEVERFAHRLKRCGLSADFSPNNLKYFIEDFLFDLRWPNYSKSALSELLDQMQIILRNRENCEFLTALYSQYGQDKGLELAFRKIDLLLAERFESAVSENYCCATAHQTRRLWQP